MRLRNVHFFLPLQHSAVDFAGECHVGPLGLALLKLYATVSHEGKLMIKHRAFARHAGGLAAQPPKTGRPQDHLARAASKLADCPGGRRPLIG